MTSTTTILSMVLLPVVRMLARRQRPQQRCFSVSSEAIDMSKPAISFKERLDKGPGLKDFVNSSKAKQPQVYPQQSSIAWWREVAKEAEVKNAANPRPVLLDDHNRMHTYLRISLTERCNLRCLYCMPEEGVDLQSSEKLLTNDEILRLAGLFVSEGVNKIRLTGGEPMVRPDLVKLTNSLTSIQGVNALGITTNGIALPRKLEGLCEAGMTHLNVSLDTLQRDKFARITRRQGLERVIAAIDSASKVVPNTVKVNCVVMRGQNEDELGDFVEFTRTRRVDVRFIEWMPFDSNSWNDSTFMSYEEMLEIITQRFPTLTRLEDQSHDTSKAWGVPGFQGQVGFITSMSNNFCGDCNRLRLTADGNLKVCLFGASELSLRDAMRAGLDDDELRHIVRAAVQRKHAALGGHGDMYGIAKAENRPMILIGG